MKRTNKLRKLNLKTETIRVLSPRELEQVAGGAGQDSRGITCTCGMMGCGSTESCPNTL